MASKAKVGAVGGVIRKAVKERSVRFQGDQVTDWDKVYEDLLDSGLTPDEAAIQLDKYMEENGIY